MAIRSTFLKSLRRFRPALAATILLAPVASAEPGSKVHWATSADGVRIAYEVHGHGSPALVFVHGWSCNRSFWAGQIEPFSKQFEVVGVDRAGHGDSGRNRAKWTIPSYSEDVAAVVKKLNLKKVILIGHSMGGDVIPEAALGLPGRVVGLI
jgi:pimeloyl-ACP methyl ester carboxylesterase